jgi:hypothetical protein
MSSLPKHKIKISFVAGAIAIAAFFWIKEEEKVLVSTVAVHYYPPEHRVDEFYINSFYRGTSNFRGLADMGLCCIGIPARWRPGLVVDVSWAVSDWSQSPAGGKDHGPSKVRLVGIYRAKVPVEQYRSAEDLFVHFFEGGKVRVVSGVADLGDLSRSKPSIDAAASKATQGRAVDEVFTAEDMAVIDKRIAADRKRYGSWR